MVGPLIRYDLSLASYFTYPPAPAIKTRAMIPRREPRGLYMRGEYGEKADGGALRPITGHNTTHLDTPYHFDADGEDVATLLNRADSVADRPCRARIVSLAGGGPVPAAHLRDGVTYCETVSADLLPPQEALRGVEALVVLTGFGGVMAQYADRPFSPEADGYYHLPWLTDDAVAHLVAAGIKLVAIDANSVERQTSVEPHRMSGDAHLALLARRPPVLILECLDGSRLASDVGFLPTEALLQLVPRRVDAVGADAATSRAFLYFYRDDPDGAALAALQTVMTPQEFHG